MATAIMLWLRSRLWAGKRSGEPPRAPSPVSPSSQSVWPKGPDDPDAPLSFGSRINWFAVRSEDGSSVAEALSLTSTRIANWDRGLAAAGGERRAHDSPLIFVTPPIDGWTLVAGAGLPYPDDVGESSTGRRIGRRFRRMFQALAERFEDVQFFGNHRVTEFAAWARAQNGHIVRVFSWVGADGAVLANEGQQTFEERLLGLLDLSGCDPAAASSYIFERMHEDDEKTAPDEEDVVRLAGHWSVDPSTLEDRRLPPGVGLVGRLAG